MRPAPEMKCNIFQLAVNIMVITRASASGNAFILLNNLVS